MPAVHSKPPGIRCADDDTPVDLDHLRRFTLNDPDLEQEILGLFAGQLPITIDALRGAASLKEWSVAAHTLKGSARAVGAWSIAAIAEEAERMASVPAPVERAALVECLEAAEVAVRAYIAALKASG